MTWKGFRDTENVWRKSWKIFGSLFYCVSDSWHAFDASKVIFLLKKSLCKESTGVGFSIEFSSRISCSCLTLLPLRLKWRVTPFWHRTQLWWCSRELFLVFDGKRRKVLYLCVLPCILKCKLWRPSASCNSFVTVVATSILISFINEFLSLSLSFIWHHLILLRTSFMVPGLMNDDPRFQLNSSSTKKGASLLRNLFQWIRPSIELTRFPRFETWLYSSPFVDATQRCLSERRVVCCQSCFLMSFCRSIFEEREIRHRLTWSHVIASYKSCCWWFPFAVC